MRLEIRAQAEAQHRQILVIHKVAQLLYLRGGEELRLVGNYHVVFSRLVVLLGNVLLRRDYLRVCLKPYAAADYVRPVARVDARLYEPYRHAELFIIELRYERLSRL